MGWEVSENRIFEDLSKVTLSCSRNRELKRYSLAPRFPHSWFLPSQVLLPAAPWAGAVRKDRFRVVPAGRAGQLQGKGSNVAGGVGGGRHGGRRRHIVRAYRQGRQWYTTGERNR